MKTLLVAGFAAVFSVGTGAALADEGSFEMRSCGPDGGCARFQGYIYVGRSAGGEVTLRPAPAAGPALDGRRLYVHTDAAEDR